MAHLTDIPYLTGLNRHELALDDATRALMKIASNMKEAYAITSNDSFFTIILKRIRYFHRKKQRLEVIYSVKKLMKIKRRFRRLLQTFSPMVEMEWYDICEMLWSYSTLFSREIANDSMLSKKLDGFSEALRITTGATEMLIRFRAGESPVIRIP